MTDTIFALSSAPGRAGIAVVRVSGPKAGSAIQALTGRPVPEPRRASLRTLHAPPATPRGTQREIDTGLVLFFTAAHSATGEDIAEFHVHGGRAIVDAVLAALGALPGLRLATPGEFTRRAVENARLDLTQAEGLADLIDAETDAQRKQALEQYGGALFRLCEDWRTRLVRLCAWTEAAIDFSDEELDPDLDAQVRGAARAVLAEMRAALADNRRGEIVRDGFHVAVIGPPNAGKSSLVNALARRDVAIVSEVPGTTRDIVETRLDLDGYCVHLADTAGLRATADAIEAEGVRRALARAQGADLTLLVLDGSAADPYAAIESDTLTAKTITVWNKCDMPWPMPREGARISARTGEGLDALVDMLLGQLRESFDRAREQPVMTRARHREQVTAAAEALARALEGTQADLIAEDYRLALRAIGRLTGRVDIEELLDVVFRDFCIGK